MGWVRKPKMIGIGAKSKAAKPVIVMAGTRGATRMLIGIDASEKCPEIAIAIGEQSTVAESGIAIISATTGASASRVLRKSVIDGERVMIPNVARTESAKPGSIP